jgi:hypothetical protein
MGCWLELGGLLARIEEALRCLMALEDSAIGLVERDLESGLEV